MKLESTKNLNYIKYWIKKAHIDNLKKDIIKSFQLFWSVSSSSADYSNNLWQNNGESIFSNEIVFVTQNAFCPIFTISFDVSLTNKPEFMFGEHKSGKKRS